MRSQVLRLTIRSSGRPPAAAYLGSLGFHQLSTHRNMKRGTEQRTVRSFCRRINNINLQPDYQRGAVWSRGQKQLLIDSILRDLDIPKIYLRELRDAAFAEEAVDGQQRLTAINEFYNGAYPLAKDADAVSGEAVAGKYFSDLSEDVKDIFEAYELTVVCLREAADEEVEEMFLRLQNGTTLSAAEKRNAMHGGMKNFVRELSTHKFFEICGFKNSRFAYDQVAAQMCRVAINGGPCSVKGSDLIKMYEQYQNLQSTDRIFKEIKKTLDLLADSFKEKTPEITKLNALSLFILFQYLRENFDIKGKTQAFAEWFIKFETWRKQDETRPSDERDSDMAGYQERSQKSTDTQDSVEFRNKVLLSRLLLEFPSLAPLDKTRQFTHEQRLAIWRRDEGNCQVKIKCAGEHCGWDHWHADHKIAWSNGGQTTVENGQVACPACNLAKSNE